MSLYLEGIINAPLLNLFTVLGEVELFKDWIPITKESRMMFEISHLRKMAYIKNNLPFPFSNREIFLSACGFLLKEKKACVLTMSSVKDNIWLGN